MDGLFISGNTWLAPLLPVPYPATNVYAQLPASPQTRFIFIEAKAVGIIV